jgi:hypothetical protein
MGETSNGQARQPGIANWSFRDRPKRNDLRAIVPSATTSTEGRPKRNDREIAIARYLRLLAGAPIGTGAIGLLMRWNDSRYAWGAQHRGGHARDLVMYSRVRDDQQV